MNESKTASSRYILPEKMAKKDIVDVLETQFVVEATEGVSENVALVDSFEWGL